MLFPYFEDISINLAFFAKKIGFTGLDFILYSHLDFFHICFFFASILRESLCLHFFPFIKALKFCSYLLQMFSCSAICKIKFIFSSFLFQNIKDYGFRRQTGSYALLTQRTKRKVGRKMIKSKGGYDLCALVLDLQSFKLSQEEVFGEQSQAECGSML